MGAEFSNAGKHIDPEKVTPISDDRDSPLNTSLNKPLAQLDSLELDNLETNLRKLQEIIESFGEHIANMLCDPLDRASESTEDGLPVSSEDLRRAFQLLTAFKVQVKQYEAIVPGIMGTTQAIERGIRENLEELTALKNETQIDIAKLHTISQDIRKHLSCDTETLTPQIHHLLDGVKLRRESSSPSSEGLI